MNGVGYISWEPQGLPVCHKICIIILDKIMYALGEGMGKVSEKLGLYENMGMGHALGEPHSM